MKRLIALAGTLAISAMLTGCPSGTQQQQAAQAAANVVDVVKAAEQAEIQTYNQGQQCVSAAVTDAQKAVCIVIPQADHAFIQKQFISIGTVGKTLDTCIRLTTGGNAGIVACANTASATVTSLNDQGALYLKSDRAKTIFGGVMSAVNLGIQTIATVLGGK
jgi:hypothetical protein